MIYKIINLTRSLEIFLKLIFIILLFFANYSNAAELYTNNEQQIIKSVIQATKEKNWKKAYILAKKIKDPTLYKAVTWLEIRNDITDKNFTQLAEFYETVKNWPQEKVIRGAVESAITLSTNKLKILEWFSKYPPMYTNNKTLYLDTKYALYKKKDALINNIKALWINAHFNKKQELEFLKKYGKDISRIDHISRIDKLVWNQRLDEAERMLRFVDNDLQKLYGARIALLNFKITPNEAIRRVSIKHKEDQGLLYNILLWHEKKKNSEEIVKLIDKIPLNPSYNDLWWEFKNRQIRTFIELKLYRAAYKLTSNHKNQAAVNYSEAEWLSGWIALRFLKLPNIARAHFKNMHNKCQYPVSVARSAYWIGRTFEQEKDLKSAKIWYSVAATYPLTFYGQLGLLKLGPEAKFNLSSKINVTDADYKNFKNNELAKLAYIFSFYNSYDLYQAFISNAVKHAKTKGEVYLIAGMGIKLNKIDMSIQAAKAASYKNIFIPEFGYPTIPIGDVDPKLKPFVYALIRQESLFNKYAKSSAGALGVMQIMPETGQRLAKSLKMKFDQRKLHLDPEYNVKLGVHYLGLLSEMFDGSYILMAASYNAGEHNVKNWIKRFGDPRLMSSIDDIVDWLESITFYETRNYVQRILESTQIYRSVIKKSDNYTSNLDKDISIKRK